MNVICFSLNDCPVSALGPYGNEWVGTPHLDRLAAEGVVFDNHISDCPDPEAARRAWLSARHHFPLGASLAATQASSPDHLARLANSGIRTVLVRNTRNSISLVDDFYASWNERFDLPPDPDDRSPMEALLRALPSILDQLQDAETPWLLWIECDRLTPPWHVPLEVFDAYIEDLLEHETNNPKQEHHESVSDDDSSCVDDDLIKREEIEEPEPPLPWADPPTGWFDQMDNPSWELLQRSFAAAMTALDADLGRVMEQLRSRNLQRSLWVFTSDRGQVLGEHGILGPFRPWLHTELVHLPLIIRLPDGLESGRRVAAFTQPADLMPTIASWLGCPLVDDASIQGYDLLPLITGQRGTIRDVACSALELGSAAEWSIRTSQWAYLLPVRVAPGDAPRLPKFYAKPDDRWEVNDLSMRSLETAERLDRRLRETIGNSELS